ncbi:MAG: fluoride efflux transporter CrcB [Salinivirgaceae bacterium]
MFIKILIIGLGGFLGTIARFLISKVIQEQTSSAFPWHTFAVNIIGSFIIGIIIAASFKNPGMNPTLKSFLAIGFCGGFTTFSTFALENQYLLATQQYITLALYILLSIITGILAVFLGMILIRQIYL